MIWATVRSWSYFCWLYRASPSLTAKNIINLIWVLTIWWCPCVEFSLVLLEEGVCYWFLLVHCSSVCSVSYGITTLFHWVLVCTRFCLSPPRVESQFSPVLWKSCNQIPLVFKVKFPGDSWSLCWISRLGSLWGSEASQSERNSSVWLVSSLWVAYVEGMGFHFIVICAPPTSSLQRLLCLWMWNIFFFFLLLLLGSSVLLSMVVWELVATLVSCFL